MDEQDRLRDGFVAAIDHGLRDDTDGGLLAPDAEIPASEAVRLAADAVLPVVQAHLDAAREQVAEQIAQAIEAEYSDSPWIRTAIDIAREHAKGDGDGLP